MNLIESHGAMVSSFTCALRLLPFIFASVMVLSSCSDSLWEPPLPGSVMAERLSPDNSHLARVIATKTMGIYIFEVQDVRTGDVLTQRTISAPVGYHTHLVTLAWLEDGRLVTATIDHDFGGDNRVFELGVDRTDS